MDPNTQTNPANDSVHEIDTSGMDDTGTTDTTTQPETTQPAQADTQTQPVQNTTTGQPVQDDSAAQPPVQTDTQTQTVQPTQTVQSNSIDSETRLNNLTNYIMQDEQLYEKVLKDTSGLSEQEITEHMNQMRSANVWGAPETNAQDAQVQQNAQQQVQQNSQVMSQQASLTPEQIQQQIQQGVQQTLAAEREKAAQQEAFSGFFAEVPELDPKNYTNATQEQKDAVVKQVTDAATIADALVKTRGLSQKDALIEGYKIASGKTQEDIDNAREQGIAEGVNAAMYNNATTGSAPRGGSSKAGEAEPDFGPGKPFTVD